MLKKQSFLVVPLLANVAVESVHTSVFRNMIFLVFDIFEYFPTVFAWIAFTFVGPHVFVKVIRIVESFSTYLAEVRILPCMVLHMPL